MSKDLKPCPFCGSTRLSEEATGAAEISGNTYQTGWIECLDCGCDGPSVDLTDETPSKKDYQLVRDEWNIRAAIAQPAKPDIPPGWESSYAIGDLLLAASNWKASTPRNARPAFDDLVKACAALVAAAQPAPAT